MQCTTEPGLFSLKGWWCNGCLFFDACKHHSNHPWRGELASLRLAYLTLPIPSPLICFVELRNALHPRVGLRPVFAPLFDRFGIVKGTWPLFKKAEIMQRIKN